VSVVLGGGGSWPPAIRAETAARAAELTAAGPMPTLAVVTATGDEASAWYVRNAGADGGQAGHRLRRHRT